MNVPSHDYECPCDLCEPEAHSVRELPTAEQVANWRVTGRLSAFVIDPPSVRELPTVAPTSADVEVAAFEELIKKVGEGKARWSRLLELLES